MAGLLDNYSLSDIASIIGIAPYGFRYIDSPSEQALPKGKGYFGGLISPTGDMSTEISASTDIGNFPLLVPTLTEAEIQYLLENQEPTPEILKKAEDFANFRMANEQSPFASPFELRMPRGLLENM
jgi:hypothetical protein